MRATPNPKPKPKPNPKPKPEPNPNPNPNANPGGDTSTFTIDADSTHLAIFTQHDPAEFERDTHYLTVPHGDHADAVDAAHVLACAGAGGAAAPTVDAGDDESLPWGEVTATLHAH